jgi:GntR family transcriptional regulator
MPPDVNSLRPARAKSQTLTEATEQELRDAIARGLYRPGSQLPAESELVQLLGVSRTVVREALRLLEEDGLITRRHGVGTFVRKHPILHNLNFNYGNTEMIRRAGFSPATSFLDVQTVPASAEVAEALSLPVGAPVLAIERVRSADGKPVVYSIDYIPQGVAGAADLESYSQEQDISVYELYQNVLGQVIEYGVARLLPVPAPAPVAKRLAVPANSVLLLLLQTDYSPQDEPVLYAREYHLSDAFDFLVMRRGPRKNEVPAHQGSAG